jgi:lipopolysaccharide biosynthesis regulator YciM
MFDSAIPLLRLETSRPNATAEAERKFVAVSFWRKVARYLSADWLRCLLLALVGVLTRLPALQGQRIWDDQYLVRDNPFIKSPLLILESFRHYLFLDSYSSHYRPVQNISYFFDYLFWNTNEFGFHLTNVLLHVSSGILLYFLLQELIPSFLFRRSRRANWQTARRRVPWLSHSAFLIALLWTVHPVHSAAIDYISGRADSLAFVFAAAGWLLFLRARRTVHRLARALIYLVAAISGLLALCSREIAIIWALIFVAHLFFIQQQTRLRTRLCASTCCLALILIYGGLRQLPETRQTFPGPANFTPPVRAVLMARALGDYGRLLFWPSRLYMERTVVPPPVHYQNHQTWVSTIGTEYLSILGLAVLGVLVFGSIKRDRWQAMRVFGAAWFIASYLPISNIVQLNATSAEHWLYLPSVGFLIFAAGVSFQLPARFRPLVTAFAILAVLALGGRSFVRSSDWSNEETFYKRTFEAGSRSARVAINLGQVYTARHAYPEAERIFRSVLEQNPDYPIAQNNLASVLAREGKNKEAEALFAIIEKNSKRTREEYPRTWIGALNLANVRHNAHQDDSALAVLERAHEDYPEVWELVQLKAEIVRQRRGAEAALRLVEDFARPNWWHQGAALALGRLYAQQGDLDLADAALRRASWLDVHDTEALRLMVQIRLRQNRLTEACQLQRRAVARQPDQPSQYVLLSNILEKMGRESEARATLAQASSLRALVQNQTAPN